MSALREITLGNLLKETAEKYPDNEAVVYVDRDFRLTYAEFDELTDTIAKGLMGLGVKKGEKVAVWANNVPYWVALQFATAKIGAVLLTVNTHYRSHELEYLLQHSETENLFIIGQYRDHDYLTTTYELIPELRTQERGQLSTDKFPHLKRVFYLGHQKHRGMYSIPELQAMAAMVTDEQYAERQAQLDPHDVVNMQYTSGTTGFPKGVQLTHYNIVNNGYWIGANQKFVAGDRLCLTVPLFHCFGCVLGVMACGQPRGDHGHPGGLRAAGRHGRHRPGAVHRRVRRADHVHRHPRPPAVLAFRLLVAAHRDHGRFAVSGGGHEAGHRQDEHARDHHLLRADRIQPGHEPDRGRRLAQAHDRDRGPGHARGRGPCGGPRDVRGSVLRAWSARSAAGAIWS